MALWTASRRVATTWLRNILAKAEGAVDPLFEKFLKERYEGGRARVPNPNPKTRARYSEVSVSTALKERSFAQRIQLEFQSWKDKGSKPEAPKKAPARAETPRWMAEQDELLQLAARGHVVAEERIGEGETANEVYKRRLKLGDEEKDFIWKPAEGEDVGARLGIPSGSYHRREAAAYDVDRLLGEGTVVPPTYTNGEGSYQQFANGSLSLFDVTEPLMPAGDLADHPDFHRINVLDTILGHEDRHPGNVLFARDSSKPGGVRFIAIDNGFTLGDPDDKVGVRAYQTRDAWTDIYEGEERQQARTEFQRSLQNIDKDLHEQVKDIDHEAFVRAMVSTGIKTKKALLSALVRLSAIQRDRKVMGSFKGEHHPLKYLGAQQEFQHMSGKEPQKLLDLAGDGPSLGDLRATVERVLAS
jgi:hypothetical protein